MELQLIRNATLKLRYGGLTFLIDPYLAAKHSQPAFAGKSNNPTIDLPCSVEEILEDVDYVMVSHLHPDHFDTVAQAVLPKNIKLLCQPEDVETISSFGFKNMEALDGTAKLGKITIHRTNGQHGTGAVLQWMGTVSGFVFQAPGEKTLYWTGDTIFCPEVQSNIGKYSPAVIVCHAGGNVFLKGTNIFGEPFGEDTESLIMDQEQVVALCKHSPDSLIVATHLEALDHETVTRKGLRAYTNQHNIGERQLLIPTDGEILKL